jgi:hypothetical protein
MSGHRRRKCRDPLGMEGRLYHTTLPSMKVALARQQTFAKQGSSARKRAAFREVAVIRHEHITDKVRMINKKNTLAAELQVGDIAELTSHPLKEG